MSNRLAMLKNIAHQTIFVCEEQENINKQFSFQSNVLRQGQTVKHCLQHKVLKMFDQ